MTDQNGKGNNKGRWKKGHSGNPNGRPSTLPPELQREVAQNKASLKALILQYLNLTQRQIAMRQAERDIPMVEAILGQVIEKAHVHGDINIFKAICEIPLGPLVNDTGELELSEDERNLVLEYRKAISHGDSLPARTGDFKEQAPST